MTEFSPAVLNPVSGEIALNMKVLANDDAIDSRYVAARKHFFDNAWEAFKFSAAVDSQLLKHLGALNNIGSSQVGTTEQQQTTSPIRTGVGDTVAASAYPANRAVDTSDAAVSVAAAGVATANQALADAVANLTTLVQGLITALQPVLVNASGGASTPSQTTTK